MSLPSSVAIDASWAQHGPSGVQRYVCELLPRLAEHLPVVALVDGRRADPELGVPTVALRAPGRASRLGWLELAVGRWLAGFDGLFHGAAYAVPLRVKGPTVVTMHDIAWVTDPTDFTASKRALWTFYGQRSASRSRAILTDSAHSAAQIVEHLGVPRARVHIVPVATSARSAGPVDAAELTRVRDRYGLQAPYLVALGGAARRQLELAQRAWQTAVANGAALDLVVIGTEAPEPGPGVVPVGQVDDATWRALLGGAEALLYPTTHEGFGLPAAEAIASGTPVICAPVGALPEVLGDAAVWSDTLSVDDLAAAIHRTIADPDELRRRRISALDRAATAPTWDDAADATVAVYEQAWSAR